LITIETIELSLSELNNLQKAKSRIHFSSDNVVVPQIGREGIGFLGVTAQWVDEDEDEDEDEVYTLQKALLGMPEVQYDHSVV